MPKHAVAITGIGTLTPAGRGTEALWKHLSSGRIASLPIDPQKYFDPSGYACQTAGQVPSFEEPRVLTRTIMAQTGRCSQMALVAVLDALDMARLPLDFRTKNSPVAPERVALAVSTIGAGWAFLEQQMDQLWRQGVKAMDRYGLTAGFLAGPQGHISILFGIEGRARTFVSERVSGAHALIEGARTIERGEAEIAIAGGAEAPLTALAWSAYHAAKGSHPTSLDEMHPYLSSLAQQADKLISEGSTFLVLEEAEHARRRGVPILAEIHGWNRGTDPLPLDGSSKQPGKGVMRGIRQSLAMADIQLPAIDALWSACPACTEEEEAEKAAIDSLFTRPLPIVASGTALGHLQGAATATDVAIATLAFERQAVPFTRQTEALPSDDNSLTAEETPELRHALVLASGLGGMHANLVISKAT